jgi:hypothetical protein
MTLIKPQTKTIKDEYRELLVGQYLMLESEYEEFYKAVSDSQPQYDWDPIFKVVAKIIKNRIDELY